MRSSQTTATLAVALSGSAAFSQVTPQVMTTLNWVEVYAGTNTPVANPNGILEPGESARITLSVEFTPIGTPVQWTEPPPGGIGPVSGLRNVHFHLRSVGEESGDWSRQVLAPGFTGGYSFPYPTELFWVNITQQRPPDPVNPIPNLWQVVWTPWLYEERTVQFDMIQIIWTHGPGWPQLYVHGWDDPTTAQPIYVTVDAQSNWDSVQIPVVPAPGAAVVAGVMFLLSAGRRRGATAMSCQSCFA